MRRALAITIIFLLSLPLAAPLFGFEASDLPACCRRNGMHHCMSGIVMAPGTPLISIIAPKCPSWPKAMAAPWAGGFACSRAHVIGLLLFAHPHSASQTNARYRICFSRSRQKRGPPAALAAS